MEKMFPATMAQKQLLSFRPKCAHCLPRTEAPSIANCINVVVFVWLTDGNGYWYYTKGAQGEMLIGYVLVNSRWVYNPIEKKQVLTYF